MTRDHSDTLLRAYSNQVREGLAIKVEILALLEDLLQAKALGLSNLTIEGYSAIVISWVINKKRGSWKFDNWMYKIIEVASELGCSSLGFPIQPTILLASQPNKELS